MANMPVSEVTVEKYMNKDKQEKILAKIKEVYETKRELEIRNVKFDYINSEEACNEKILGRYNGATKTIIINKYELREKVNCFGKGIETASYKLLLCDLVFMHELFHAYQDQIENNCMKKGEKFLEVDANRRAVTVFILKYDCISCEIKRNIVEHYVKYLSSNKYKLGDGVTVDSFIEEVERNPGVE